MGRIKKGLTIERHREIGKVLREMHDNLSHIYVEVSNAYPDVGPGGLARRSLKSTLNRLDAARSFLDSKCSSEHSGEWDVDVYYPQHSL